MDYEILKLCQYAACSIYNNEMIVKFSYAQCFFNFFAISNTVKSCDFTLGHFLISPQIAALTHWSKNKENIGISKY